MTVRRNVRSASLPAPPPLRPSELARLNLPPPPLEYDFENEQWTRFSSKVGRLAGRGKADDAWGWNGAVPKRSYQSETTSEPPRPFGLPERRSTAPAMCSSNPRPSTRQSSSDDRATVALSRTASTASTSSRSSISSTASSPRVHFLEPLPPTEDDATDLLIRRLLAAFDTTGWCSLVERALEFPIPMSMDVTDHCTRDRSGSHMAKSLTGLADMITKGDLGRCRSDPLLCTMALREHDEPDLGKDTVEKEGNQISGGSWWNLGDFLTLL